MTLRKLLLLFCVFCSQLVLAQDSIVNKLQEVIVSDIYLKKYSSSQNLISLSDSIINYNKPSLTSLLNYNTTIYFKENGLGMVSSPSFRGTTAQQTAVIWNGININSQLNGQTDFNTISTKNFDNITVRAGGGSAIYGSSAIGGTIHLNNDLIFNNTILNELQLDYGSFNTLGIHFNSKISTNNVATQIGFSRNSSDNDYDFPQTNKKNENGQFYNNSLNINFGYKLSAKHYFKLYSQLFDGERHFSAAFASVSQTKYQNLDTRNLLEWKAIFNEFISTLKVAHLQEEYKYFENKLNSNYSFGKSQTSIIKYDISFNLSDKISLNAITDYSQTLGLGSGLLSDIRKIGSVSLLLNHKAFNWFSYEFSGRKEITNQYVSPFLFSLGTIFQPFKFYKIKLNTSRNFRIPSFNDLYWKGSGNPDLKPENSYQGEISQELFYKNISFQLTGFGIKVNELLRWKPNIYGVWSPENVEKVTTYGFEMVLKANKKINHHLFDLTTNYAFTKSVNEKSNRELIYVPNHKWVTNFKYAWKNLSLNNQLLYNGKVFTSSDNQNILSDYLVLNSGFNLAFGKYQNIILGLNTSNILNENYQNVLGRPMPGRNYTMNINLNF